MLASSLLWGCQQFNINDEINLDADALNGNVEVLEDGRIKVTTSLERLGMTSVETRAEDIYEDVIYNGWCLVFGATTPQSTNYSSEGYGDESPLIQKVPITANANGTFFMTFDPYDGKSFMRIVVNLTDRENETLSNITSWQDLVAAYPEFGVATELPSYDDVVTYRDNNGLATFGQYRQQSVGLDGIYNIDYNTSPTLEYNATGYLDYSNVRTYWNVNYQNTDANHTSGSNYITKLAETYNGNVPNPANDLNTSTGFPMASYGFVLDNLSETTLANAFGTTIDMIRVCSKVVVDVSETYDASGSGFDMQAVYLIDAPQEARIRSTVMSDVVEDGDGNASATSTTFNLPVDLGGLITYEPMTVSSGTKVSDPIYFYPNSGGDYSYSSTVNQDINPQYIIIKGQAAGYDTPGYYKVALKAQYPLVNDPNPDVASDWSDLTYDILRNTFFTIKITDVDKPGYKTFDDAADVNSPANNISYSITIEADDNRYEILVSKGTYYTELETSRVYLKGYGDEGVKDCYVDFTMHPSQEGNYTPNVYVQSSDYNGIATSQDVSIQYCKVLYKGEAGYATDDWSSATVIGLEDNETGDGLGDKLVHIGSSDTDTKVRVYFSATDSGRIRLRMGDILKFIPVVYESTAVSRYGEETFTVADSYGTSWSNFSYAKDSDIEYLDGYNDAILAKDGSIISNASQYESEELRAKVYTSDNSGIALLYVKQASDFNLYDNVTESEAVSSQAIVYQSTGNIYTYNGTDVESISGNDARSYTVNGDISVVYSGNFSNFTSSGWSTSNDFSFSAENIGTNMTNNVYDEDNSHLENTASVTLTNIAGETKTYTFNIEQYALPYTSGAHYVCDGAGNVTTNSTSYFDADCYGNRGKGDDVGTFYVYNVEYTPQKYDGSLGYQWANTFISGITNSTSSVEEYVSCDYQGKNSDNISTFYLFRNQNGNWDIGATYRYAMFQVVCKNGANEQVTAGVNVRVNRT